MAALTCVNCMYRSGFGSAVLTMWGWRMTFREHENLLCASREEPRAVSGVGNRAEQQFKRSRKGGAHVKTHMEMAGRHPVKPSGEGTWQE